MHHDPESLSQKYEKFQEEFIDLYLTKYAFKSYSDLCHSFRHGKGVLDALIDSGMYKMGGVRFWNSFSKEEFIELVKEIQLTYPDIDELVVKVKESFKEDEEEFAVTVSHRKLKDKVVSWEFDHGEVTKWLEEFRRIHLRGDRVEGNASDLSG